MTAAGVRMSVGEQAIWVVSVMHDITDTEHLERLRDQFFTAAAHSLKTPVAVIKADVQSLMPAAAPKQRRIAASIDRQCDRIDRLVQNLMVLSRSRSRTLELHPSEMELRPLVEQIAREGVWSYRHEVRTELTGSPSIRADHERLALVIRNLMYEASRLSLADSPLTLVARPEGDRVAVGVRYRPLPWRDRVQRDLRRLRRHRHRTVGGGDDRRGTRRLAERRGHRHGNDQLDPPARRRHGSARVNQCNDVLIVDDDLDMIEVIELVLHDAGYTTRSALNGQQALDAVAAEMPALIVLDMLMPVMNGWQFAQEFRSRYGRAVPIVVATAAEHVERRRNGLDVTDVLPKPFEVSDLLRLVARHVQLPPPASVQ